MALVDTSRLRDELTRRGEAAFSAAVDEMALFTRAESPVDTGETRQSVTTEITSGPPFCSAVLEAPTPQARYTDEGTGPHVIEGNPLLVFEWQGRTVFFRSVNHPGSTKHVGWFSEGVVNDDRWGSALESGWALNG